MKLLFWIAFFGIIYTYGGYFLLLAVITAFKREKTCGITPLPSVSLIIAAYNEEAAIGRKLEESLKLDYPKDKLEIIVASDASTDRTDGIVKRFAQRGVVLVRQDKRKGKTATQNMAVDKARGEILVFSDATTCYKKDAVKKLVRNFGDAQVGMVGGEEVFLEDVSGRMLEEVSLSWDYEKTLRRLEGKFGTLIGVSGCIFAIRRELYEKLDENLIENFALPLRVIEKGYKVGLEKEAIGYEKTAAKSKDEFKRKARIVSGGINVLFRMRRLLNPLRYPKVAFQLISHKVFRWLTPVFLVGLFISNSFLLNESLFFRIFFLVQTTCYLLAIGGVAVRGSNTYVKILKIPFYFCLVNLAVIAGIFKFLFRDNKVIWEPVR